MRLREGVTDAAVGSFAGIAAGFVAGIGARVAMRMVADGVPDGVRQLAAFTPEGSAAIAVAGAIAGAPFGALYAAVAPRITWPHAVRGLGFGVLLLVTVGPAFFLGNPDEFFTRGRVALFAALFPLFGIALGLAFLPSRRIVPAWPGAAQAALTFVACVGGSLVAIGIASSVLRSTGLVAM